MLKLSKMMGIEYTTFTLCTAVKGFVWQIKRLLLKFTWVAFPLMLIAYINYTLSDPKQEAKHSHNKRMNGSRAMDFINEQSLRVKADRWIVVDGTDISDEDVLHVDDVPGWRVLVFKRNLRLNKERRCNKCLFVNNAVQEKMDIPTSNMNSIKMTSYLYVIQHGAKWIYVTNQVKSLAEQVEGFHFHKTLTGLFYNSQMSFDPDRHFGVKDFTVDHTLRNKNNMYLHGEYETPSVQSKWRPPEHFVGTDHFDLENTACRLPNAIINPRQFPVTDLMGSLIGASSFWTLGSLLSESDPLPFAYWWLWLMRDTNGAIGKYPPSCKAVSVLQNSETFALSNDIESLLSKLSCNGHGHFFSCAVHLIRAMQEIDLVTQADVELMRIWVGALTYINYKEPERLRSKETSKSFALNDTMTHKVLFEPSSKTHSEHETFENPFVDICKSTVPVPNSTDRPPIRDILLVIVFNYSSYYKNILYLDYMYRRFFTNIVYCGSKLGNFGLFQREYLRPINFLELNEIDRGIHGYLCAAYAMELGFKVNGYLQMSDDVLLNMWNVADLPRDKIWFQQSFKKGSLKADKVPNITPVMEQWYWWPWSCKQWGVGNLRKMWAKFEQLEKTQESYRITSFLTILEENFGGKSGAFYEASDIFYVPERYRDNFNYFIKLSFKHKIFLEIGVPTVLAGLESFENIHRLNGTYLWYQQRTDYEGYFNPQKVFLHPWKVKEMMTKMKSRVFICTKYLPYIEGKSTIH